MLEHEAHASIACAALRRVLALEVHGAPIRELEAGNDPQQSGLAGAGWTEECHQLTVFHLQADAAQGLEIAEALREVAHLDAHAAPLRRPSLHSSALLAASVTSASSASSEATAKADAV